MNINSIDWGYIMDVAIAGIIGALIAVAGSIVTNWLGNRKGYKDIEGKIGALDNTTLSGQHKRITEDIVNSISDNAKDLKNKIGTLDDTTLSGQNKDIIRRVEGISQFLEKEKEAKFQRNSLLNYETQIINNSIENLSGFAEIMKNLSAENSTLKSENHNIKIENQKLTQENSELKEELAQYQTPNNAFTQSMQ